MLSFYSQIGMCNMAWTAPYPAATFQDPQEMQLKPVPWLDPKAGREVPPQELSKCSGPHLASDHQQLCRVGSYKNRAWIFCAGPVRAANNTQEVVDGCPPQADEYPNSSARFVPCFLFFFLCFKTEADLSITSHLDPCYKNYFWFVY